VNRWELVRTGALAARPCCRASEGWVCARRAWQEACHRRAQAMARLISGTALCAANVGSLVKEQHVVQTGDDGSRIKHQNLKGMEQATVKIAVTRHTVTNLKGRECMPAMPANKTRFAWPACSEQRPRAHHHGSSAGALDTCHVHHSRSQSQPHHLQEPVQVYASIRTQQQRTSRKNGKRLLYSTGITCLRLRKPGTLNNHGWYDLR
jgi:hypothetical protein